MAYEPHPPRLGLGITLSLIAFLFFVTASSLVSGFRGRFPTIQIIFIQNAVSFLCILPFCIQKGIQGLKTKWIREHLVRDLFGVSSYFFYFLAIRYVAFVDATTLNYTAPFFVPLIWRLWRKEKVGGHVWWAIVVGFIGVGVILKPTTALINPGFFCGIAAGLASAIAFCSLRILNLYKEPMFRTLFYYFLFGTVVSFPFACKVWSSPIEMEWVQAIGIGVATAIGQMLLTIAYRYGTASHLSPLGYSTVIYAGVIGRIFLGQPIGLSEWIGAALIIMGGTATYVLKKKPESFAETFETPKPHEKPPLR